MHAVIYRFAYMIVELLYSSIDYDFFDCDFGSPSLKASLPSRDCHRYRQFFTLGRTVLPFIGLPCTKVQTISSTYVYCCGSDYTSIPLKCTTPGGSGPFANSNCEASPSPPPPPPSLACSKGDRRLINDLIITESIALFI